MMPPPLIDGGCHRSFRSVRSISERQAKVSGKGNLASSAKKDKGKAMSGCPISVSPTHHCWQASFTMNVQRMQIHVHKHRFQPINDGSVPSTVARPCSTVPGE
jgi:hypothetical protein